MNTFDLAVLGGGIVGSTAALLAARIGMSVSLAEKKSPGAGASSASAGLLVRPSFLDPETPPEEANPYALLSERGYQYFPDFLDMLRDTSTVDVQRDRCGSWEVALTEREVGDRKNYMKEMKKYKRSPEWADHSKLKRMYPFLSDRVKGGFLDPDTARVRPDRIMKALSESLDRRDRVELFPETEVTSLQVGPEDRIEVAETTRGPLRADQYLLACGCWTSHFEDDLDRPLPVSPRKGQMIRVERPTMAGEPVFRREECYVIPRREGVVDIGATTENTGYDRSITDDAREELLQNADRIITGIKKDRLRQHWAGLRPFAEKKGGPFLGEIPEYENAYIAAGHYKKGILQGPISAKLIVQSLQDKHTDIPMDPYHLDR